MLAIAIASRLLVPDNPRHAIASIEGPEWLVERLAGNFRRVAISHGLKVICHEDNTGGLAALSLRVAADTDAATAIAIAAANP